MVGDKQVLNGGGSGDRLCEALREFMYPVYNASPSNVCGVGDAGGVVDNCENDVMEHCDDSTGSKVAAG